MTHEDLLKKTRTFFLYVWYNYLYNTFDMDPILVQCWVQY